MAESQDLESKIEDSSFVDVLRFAFEPIYSLRHLDKDNNFPIGEMYFEFFKLLGYGIVISDLYKKFMK